MVIIPSRDARTPHVRTCGRTEREMERRTDRRTEGDTTHNKKRVHTWVLRRAGEPR
ncbi:hypothetical protein HETIRDRAFT_165464 [Heterobasidion irregulare TC 32-1]|uniref:Uncharacterized protein n=1 Tax=Heterobasidion irregulare (strain TC 32-1) TaxID=747525 RepID=W4KC91_HETIT|nr:uncharacterized protein HETIRDRAFT_165464 [Heterobasidion irregulare TC 32-1]ETW82696.1 hypothetical protein HETIRDRAFT_165464 [Heterobasidion irregulare TC 32-1]